MVQYEIKEGNTKDSELLIYLLLSMRDVSFCDRYKYQYIYLLLSLINHCLMPSQLLIARTQNISATVSEYDKLVRNCYSRYIDLKNGKYFYHTKNSNRYAVPTRKAIESLAHYIDGKRNLFPYPVQDMLPGSYETLKAYLEEIYAGIEKINSKNIEHMRGIADFFITERIFNPVAKVYKEAPIYNDGADYRQNRNRMGLVIRYNGPSFRPDAISISELPTGKGDMHDKSVCFFEHDTSSQRKVVIRSKLENYAAFFKDLQRETDYSMFSLLFALSNSYLENPYDPTQQLQEEFHKMRKISECEKDTNFFFNTWYFEPLCMDSEHLLLPGSSSMKNTLCSLHGDFYFYLSAGCQTLNDCYLFLERAAGEPYGSLNINVKGYMEHITKKKRNLDQFCKHFSIEKRDTPVKSLFHLLDDTARINRANKASMRALQEMFAYLNRRDLILEQFELISELRYQSLHGKRIICVPEQNMLKYFFFLFPYVYRGTDIIFERLTHFGYPAYKQISYSPFYKKIMRPNSLVLCNHYTARESAELSNHAKDRAPSFGQTSSAMSGTSRHFVFEDYSMDLGSRHRLKNLAEQILLCGDHLTVIFFFLSYDLPFVRTAAGDFYDKLKRDNTFSVLLEKDIEVLFWCEEDFHAGNAPLFFDGNLNACYLKSDFKEGNFLVPPAFLSCEIIESY